MALSRHERKDALGHGGQRKAARRAKVSESAISLLMNDKQPPIRQKRIDKAKKVIAEMIHEANPDIAPEEVWESAA